MDSDEAWQLLLEGQQRGAMLCCAWDGKGKEAIEKGTGLVSQHCYTVVQVRNVSNGFRLLQCRNPWADDREWGLENPEDCPWSDNSPLWEQYPDVAKEVGFEGPKSDGLFWISWELFEDYGKKLVISWLDGTVPENAGEGVRLGQQSATPSHPCFFSKKVG